MGQKSQLLRLFRQKSRQMHMEHLRKAMTIPHMLDLHLTFIGRYLQVAKVRFGVIGHLAYMFAALVANFVVGSEILIGGAGVFAGLTGISIYAAIWLLPLVVAAYGSC
jgi:uncharacterized membrane-anchored protein